MNLKELKNILSQCTEMYFKTETEFIIPRHFHITEVGLVTKKFVDCGGKYREETKVSFQFWHSTDVDHRLTPQRLQHILETSEKQLDLDENLEIEVEYQGESTINKFGLNYLGKSDFVLTNKATDCLAKDNCGVELEEKPQENCCSPDSNCC